MSLTEPLQGERLEGLLDRFPSGPGVYLMKDLRDQVIYVGKAKNLRARVRSYFRMSGDNRAFVSRLGRMLGDIQVVVTPSEKDALILERELIGHHRPRFNIDFKDNKNFLSIRIADKHIYPRMNLERRPPSGEQPGRWFGPYPSAASARETFRLIQSTFQLRICTDTVFAHRARPCLQHQMGRCLGPCVLEVPQELYRKRVKGSVAVLRGRMEELVTELDAQMKAASLELRFEDAARLRDRIQAVKRSLEHQQVIDQTQRDRDVLALYREGASGMLMLMQVRRGRWLGATRFPFKQVEAADADVIRQFLSQHYGSGADLPPEILLTEAARLGAESHNELFVLADWLSEQRGSKVSLMVPKRGRAARLVRTAWDNAKEAYRASLATESILTDRLERLKDRLGLSRLPRRIECFDLSTMGGRESVGSMAVLVDGEPDSSAYRRFRIREAASDSDVAMMREVVGRRFRPILEGTEEGPDLVVLDGGMGQLRVVEALFADLGVADVDLVALAKGRSAKPRNRRERVFVPGRKNPIPLRPESDELYLLGLARDEAHRFAIGYHRKLRRKSSLRSRLEEIPGVGPALRRRLLTRFKSLEGIREAGLEELASVCGVSASLADRILRQIQALTSRKCPGSHGG